MADTINFTALGLTGAGVVTQTGAKAFAKLASSSNLPNFSNDVNSVITAQKALANGLATLDGTGKIPTAQLPAIVIGEPFVVNSQAQQLALDAQVGDICIRTDISTNFVRNNGSSGTMADWTELLFPLPPVLSVNTKTGAITLTTTDINEGTNLYYTDTRADARISLQKGASGGLATLDSSILVPVAQIPTITSAKISDFNSATDARISAATIINTQVTGLGTISTQNASSVAISGGTINGASVGLTTPAFLQNLTDKVAVTGAHTVLQSNCSKWHYCNSASAVSVTLPNTGITTGAIFPFQNIGSGTVTFAKVGADTLSGRTTLAGGDWAIAHRDASGSWRIIGGTATSYNAYTMNGSNLTLTNPLPNVIEVTATVTGQKVFLPAMDVSGLPAGFSFRIINSNLGGGSTNFDIYYNDTTTALLTNLSPGQTAQLFIRNTSTSNGNLGYIVTGDGIVRTSVNYTATSSDTSILGDTTSGNITITLPTVTSFEGKLYRIIKPVVANTLILQAQSGDTVNNFSTNGNTLNVGTTGLYQLVSGGLTAWYFK